MTETEQLLAWIFAQPAPKTVNSMRFGGVTIGSLCYVTLQETHTRIRVSGDRK